MCIRQLRLWDDGGFHDDNMTGHGFGLGELLVHMAPLEGSSYSLTLGMHHAIYGERSLILLLEQVAKVYSGKPIESRPAFTPFIEHLTGLDLASESKL